MPDNYAVLLNPEKARIFRIIHRANLPWVLDHGLHCGNSATLAAKWVSIGNQELISKRASWPVPVPPGGVLNDYVPFYFTPFSVMMHNINTGWGGVTKHPKQDILILVSSLRRVAALGLTFLFSDSHANNSLVTYASDLTELGRVDWALLQARDFKRDPVNDPGKVGRYQAEALVHRHCPIEGLSGIVCYTENVKIEIEQALAERGLNLQVIARTGWYF
jgi:ssDNA thymidine ADP-ribosyltransferase, DarT